MKVICDNCGKEFDKKKSNIELTKHNYCSQDCVKEYRKRKPKICLECGKEFLGESDSKFCSRSCSAIQNNQLYPKREKEKRERKIKFIDPEILKTCNLCLVSKKSSEFFSGYGYCKKCYYEKRRESPNSKTARDKYREKNKESAKIYSKSYRTFLKTKFLEMYGTKCSCCGESEYEFLTLDHIIPRTSENRYETGNNAYIKATKEYRPDLYQVLCYNCNCSRRHGTCPHKKVVEEITFSI